MSLPLHSTYLRWLRWSLVCGGAYDLVFAVLMIVWPEGPTRILSLPLPGETFYLWLMAIFLCMLAGMYFLAAFDPWSYRGNIWVAIVGRSAGAVAFGLAALADPQLSGLWVVAGADLLFGVVHALTLFAAKKGRIG